MSKLLLFSLLTFCTAALAQSRTSGATQLPDDFASPTASPFAGMPQGPGSFTGNQTNTSEQERTCLRIHAFIFTTEDDRVPKLVRETTCMPASTAAAKKANGSMQPRLTPADGRSY